MDERKLELLFPEAHGGWSRQRERLKDSYPSELDEEEAPELNELEQLLSD